MAGCRWEAAWSLKERTVLEFWSQSLALSLALGDIVERWLAETGLVAVAVVVAVQGQGVPYSASGDCAHHAAHSLAAVHPSDVLPFDCRQCSIADAGDAAVAAASGWWGRSRDLECRDWVPLARARSAHSTTRLDWCSNSSRTG